MNNFIFLGPPGAGKGSLAVKVAEDYKIPHISTGDIFRANIKAQTPLGVKVKAIIDSGSLVSDELTFELVKDRLAQDDCKNGYILDGFPRTIPQAEMLEGLVSDVKVVNFEIQDEIVIRRLSTRRVCKACGANFNVLTLPPKVEGICDKCGGELYQRDDDKQESIMHRMDVYREQTEPLINFYKNKGKITDLDASIETDVLLGKFKEIFPL
ncbi:MAG: adenylate kinase [Treponema sp.]|nr:adenylate kinase [Treponema sp.]